MGHGWANCWGGVEGTRLLGVVLCVVFLRNCEALKITYSAGLGIQFGKIRIPICNKPRISCTVLLAFQDVSITCACTILGVGLNLVHQVFLDLLLCSLHSAQHHVAQGTLIYTVDHLCNSPHHQIVEVTASAWCVYSCRCYSPNGLA